MTRHLLGLGHRRIGFIGGRPKFGSAELRFQAFRDVMTTAGAFDPDLVRAGDYTRESGQAAGLELLGLAQRPTAIFAANDSMAIGVIALAQQRGLRIPTDLSVAGIDDITLAASIWPALTTVRQPIIAMGVAAANYIVAASTASCAPPSLPFFAHELVIRDSTAPPALP